MVNRALAARTTTAGKRALKGIPSKSYSLLRTRGDRRGVLQELVGPGDEVLPVGAVGVAAVVLTPGELAVQQAAVDRRHLLLRVVVGDAQGLGAEKTEDRLRRDSGHVAALLIEPFRIAAFGDTVADERQPRGAEREQF